MWYLKQIKKLKTKKGKLTIKISLPLITVELEIEFDPKED